MYLRTLTKKGVNYLKQALMVLEIIVSIVLIVSVILQPGRDAGFSSGAITGLSSQVSDIKSKGKEGFLKNVTKASAVLFLILAIVLSAI